MVRNWGEDPTGLWKLKVKDLDTSTSTSGEKKIRQWKLTVYGRSDENSYQEVVNCIDDVDFAFKGHPKKSCANWVKFLTLFIK